MSAAAGGTRFGSVVFDCDSTLSAVEGIEELAAGHRAEVTALTEAAMRGEVPLEEVYGRRLGLVRPTRTAVDALGRRYIEALVPDARETVAALRDEGVVVRVVSAGLLPAVRAVAAELGLADDDVAAVGIRFSDDGAYAGYEDDSPLTRSGGKRRVLEGWAGELPRPVMMVGDGANDVGARPAVDRFVAFAGVVERPAVTASADRVILARSLAPVVPLALDGPPSTAAASAVYEKGLRLLSAGAADGADA